MQHQQPSLASLDLCDLFWCASFQTRYNEPTGVKYAKVRCLALLADPNTAEAVIAELGEYAGDIDPLLARQAIRAVGKICLRLPGSAAAAIERLIDLMGMDVRQQRVDVVVREGSGLDVWIGGGERWSLGWRCIFVASKNDTSV